MAHKSNQGLHCFLVAVPTDRRGFNTKHIDQSRRVNQNPAFPLKVSPSAETIPICRAGFAASLMRNNTFPVAFIPAVSKQTDPPVCNSVTLKHRRLDFLSLFLQNNPKSIIAQMCSRLVYSGKLLSRCVCIKLIRLAPFQHPRPEPLVCKGDSHLRQL